MNVELLSIGSELTLGEIADTNAAYISRRLAGLGFRNRRATTVSDERREVVTAVREAVSRSSLVIITGGLGPTRDDLTRESVAEALGLELSLYPEALEAIAARFGWSVEKIGEDHRVQAYAPSGSRLLPNPRGTAPGFHVEKDGAHVFVLPGVPHEMYAMLDEHVLPAVDRLWPDRPAQVVRTLHVEGVRESKIAETLEDMWHSGKVVQMGTRVRGGTIDIRLLARGKDAGGLREEIERVEADIRDRLGDHVYGADEGSLEEGTVEFLAKRSFTVALAESCTAGLVASSIGSVAGASAVLLGGVVTYSNKSKEELLGVSAELLRSKGAVCGEVARAMADGVRERFGADIGLGVTGIAGPSGGSEKKPVGLVYVGTSSVCGAEVRELRLRGERNVVRRRAARISLVCLRTAARELESSKSSVRS